MRQPVLILVAIGLILGCDSIPTDPPQTDLIRDETAPVQTGSLLYLLDQTEMRHSSGFMEKLEALVDYRYTNPTDQTIYIVKCRSVGFQLEKRGDTGKWIEVWNGPDYTRCLGEPTVVHSAATFPGTLLVSGYKPNTQAWPQFAASEMEGVFRLKLLSAVYLEDPSDYPDGIEVESEHLYSNQFEFRFR